MLVDGHHHAWREDELPFAWMQGRRAPLARAAPLAEYDAEARAAGVAASVLVEGGLPVQDPRRLLCSAARLDLVRAVVVGLPGDGLLDPRAADHLDRLLAGEGGALLRAVRFFPPADLGPRWAAHPRLRGALRALASRGLALEVVARSGDLAGLHQVAFTVDGLAMVLDHLVKPPLHDDDAFDRWRVETETLHDVERAVVKVSGLGHRVVDPAERAVPGRDAAAVRHLVDVVGPGRVMVGSDWPVSTLDRGLRPTLTGSLDLLGAVGPAVREQVAWRTADRVYGLRLSSRRR